MTVLLENTLTKFLDLDIQAAEAEIVTWQGREALRLENGLALIPNYKIIGASI